MISHTDTYRAAITADARKMLLRAVVYIIDPDITFGTVTSSGEAAFSKSMQIHDKESQLDSRYATLERGRWLLDGTFRLIPDNAVDLTGQIGFVGDVLSGDDGTFSPAVYVQENFSNVSILQAFSVQFPTDDFDGIPVDFTVDVIQGSTAYFSKTITGNTESYLSFDGFTVQNPDAIKITVTKWSLPGRRMRVPEIIPGLYESWDNDIIAKFDVKQQSDVSCLNLQYGTCTLRMDNLDRRFEPRSKTGVFQSIEERQGIDVSIGVKFPDGSTDWKHIGVYYQFDGGWRTGDNGITMQWELADIIGLLADREFIVPDTLPTTLNGWMAALVAQLGINFSSFYHADPDYGSLSVTANSKDAVTGKKCGEILLWVCQATGTWPRADAETGYLTAEPLWNQGNKLDLDNMTIYPVMKANASIANLIFNLTDGTQYVIAGTSASASETRTIDNPFLHTQAQALAAARLILATYGGNRMETTGRGDPSSEIGDVDTVWLDESSATTGRRIMQTFTIQDGVLQNCQSVFLQADGGFLFQDCALITESGTWKAPAGVTRLRVVIGQGGQGGMKGQDGYLRRAQWENSVEAGYGEPGQDGSGGKIWHGTIDINPEQSFTVRIGRGGAPSDTYGVPGAEGGETTFGPYSSANGTVYPLGYTDISNGSSFGRTGVEAPAAGTGDGGKGGDGGEPGVGYLYQNEGDIGYRFKKVKDPGPGKPGKAGASGFVLVFWDKPEA